jgi:hypothetical protein
MTPQPDNEIDDKSPPSLTVWERPNHKLESQYGFIKYSAWCEYEVDRMNRAAGRNYCRIERDKDVTGGFDVIAIVKNRQ